MSNLVRSYNQMSKHSALNIFWFGGASDTGPKDEHELCVSFENKYGSIQQVLHTYKDLHNESYIDDLVFTTRMISKASREDMDTLLGSIEQFINDVDEYYRRGK